MGSKNYYPFSRLGRRLRELVCHVLQPYAEFAQMAGPPLLPVHGKDSVCSSYVAGSRLTAKMETGKCEDRFAGAMLSENHIRSSEEGTLYL